MINLCERGRTEDEIVAMAKNCTNIKVALKNNAAKRKQSSMSKRSKESKQWNVDELALWM